MSNDPIVKIEVFNREDLDAYEVLLYANGMVVDAAMVDSWDEVIEVIEEFVL